jgi:23S rRNA (cytidine2498-2'-O)-methyltransferase
MSADPQFVFVVCQRGFEGAIKTELAASHPAFRPAYARPGFLTFKVPPEHCLDEKFELKSVFARTYGFSLGKLSGTDAVALSREAWKLAGPGPWRAVHVWQRDEPAITPLAEEIGQVLLANAPTLDTTPTELTTPRLNQPASRGERVLDLVLVEPHEWWLGWHRAETVPQRWPGGMCPLELPEHAVSRAYLKMAESLEWSQMPMKRGEVVAEIGSAPGGSCQALLDRGLTVIGVDPAEMDPAVLAHPNFLHVRKRAKDAKRREFTPVRWLAADLNVAPTYTLDTVEGIITHPEVHIRGLLLTLKLPDMALVSEIPAYLERIRGWGYKYVRAHQLSHNRHEICVAALKNRALRRERHLQARVKESEPGALATGGVEEERSEPLGLEVESEE